MSDQVKLCPLKDIFHKPGADHPSRFCDEGRCGLWIERKYQHETGCAIAVTGTALAIMVDQHSEWQKKREDLIKLFQTAMKKIITNA